MGFNFKNSIALKGTLPNMLLNVFNLGLWTTIIEIGMLLGQLNGNAKKREENTKGHASIFGKIEKETGEQCTQIAMGHLNKHNTS